MAPRGSGKAPRDFEKGQDVRVWWPPTSDKQKTDFAGMFWPVKITSLESGGKYRVVYDNGETELVKGEHVHASDAPVSFGREGVKLQVGEFVEVSNNSKTDPAAWLAKVKQVEEDDNYLVTYPFHDEPDETMPMEQLRRARLYDKEKGWVIIKPGQTWADGEVESPLELETFTPKELAEYIQQGDEPEENGNGTKIPIKGGVSKKQSKSPARANGGASKRKGKPERAKV